MIPIGKYLFVMKLSEVERVGGGKTPQYAVVKPNTAQIGTIRWVSSWRQYCFFPNPSTFYSRGCLRDIADFIGNLMDDRKNKWGNK